MNGTKPWWLSKTMLSGLTQVVLWAGVAVGVELNAEQVGAALVALFQLLSVLGIISGNITLWGRKTANTRIK